MKYMTTRRDWQSAPRWIIYWNAARPTKNNKKNSYYLQKMDNTSFHTDMMKKHMMNLK